MNGGQPPLTYKRFQTLVSRLDPPEMPVDTSSSSMMGCCITPVSEDHGDKYGVPSLEELGGSGQRSTSSAHQSAWLKISLANQSTSQAGRLVELGFGSGQTVNKNVNQAVICQGAGGA